MKLRMIAALALTVPLLAQGPPPPPPPAELKAYLVLNDAQVQALEQSRRQQEEALAGLREEIAQKERTLQEQLRAGSTDAAALGKLLLDIESLRKRAEQIRAGFQTKALGNLTTEQKTRLKGLEEAAKLQPAIRQAIGLTLLTPPEPPAGAPPPGPGLHRMRPRML